MNFYFGDWKEEDIARHLSQGVGDAVCSDHSEYPNVIISIEFRPGQRQLYVVIVEEYF
jgi:hypothetical protein